MGLSSAADVECQSIMRFLKQEEMETLVATSEENSATIQSISETIAAQNNSVKDILTEIDEIAGVSTKLEEHFDMEQAQCHTHTDTHTQRHAHTDRHTRRHTHTDTHMQTHTH